MRLLLLLLLLLLLTYLLTPRSRVLLEKLNGFAAVKKFPAFYGTRRFITVLTSARVIIIIIIIIIITVVVEILRVVTMNNKIFRGVTRCSLVINLF